MDTSSHLLEFEVSQPSGGKTLRRVRVSVFQVDKKLEFPRARLILEETLGEGEFGRVVLGKALDLTGSGYTKVAVKMLKSHYSAYELQDLLTEYSLLKEVDHPNVIKLLGACIDKAGPILLIMEFAEHGSLRSYLHLCRGGVTLSGGRQGEYQHRAVEHSKANQITSKDLLCFSWQVGRGMEYLSKKKVNSSPALQYCSVTVKLIINHRVLH